MKQPANQADSQMGKSIQQLQRVESSSRDRPRYSAAARHAVAQANGRRIERAIRATPMSSTSGQAVQV